MRSWRRRRIIASRWKRSLGRFNPTSWICKSKSLAIETDQKRLRENLGKYSTTPGEWVNRGPVLDALYTGNIKLEQIWLPDMKINYNFSSVARYDRCIVCHRPIDKTAPGSATEPAYPAIPRDKRDRIVQLGTPADGAERGCRATVRTMRWRRFMASFWPSAGRSIRTR